MYADSLSDQLAEALGDRLPPAWREAYRAVPRHLFIPDRAQAGGISSAPTTIDRLADPGGWLRAVYSTDVIITQHDGQGRSTSSCSMPEIVFAMLDLLDAQPGQRVLEIGTGTGWNAALLAYRLGDHHVTTIEVDPDIAKTAQDNLDRAGGNPTVITGDGALGHPPAAPFDRVIATCAVHQVPYPWVEQTRPGGVIIAPVGTPLDSGAIAKLIISDDGTATGRFTIGASFMRLRGQRFDAPDEPDDFHDRATVTTTDLDPLHALYDPCSLPIGHLVPQCRQGYDRADDGTVRQLGPRGCGMRWRRHTTGGYVPASLITPGSASLSPVTGNGCGSTSRSRRCPTAGDPARRRRTANPCVDGRRRSGRNPVLNSLWCGPVFYSDHDAGCPSLRA